MKNQEGSGLKYTIAPFFRDLPRSLFGHLAETVGELTESHKKVAEALEVIRIEDYIRDDRRFLGRTKISRKALGRAFLAKATLGTPTTKGFIELLRVDRALCKICGFADGKVPSESVFSRAFADFAEEDLLSRAHESQVRLHFSNEVVINSSIDATAIDAREKPAKKPKKAPREKKKRGRKPNGERAAPKEPTRQENQLEQDWKTSSAELPKVCDIGCKKNSKGHVEHWIGYKLHVDVTDGGVPLAAWTTSASVHDSQVAIPLMQMAGARVLACCYKLMDRGYIGDAIRKMAESLGQKAIVQEKSSRGEPEIRSASFFKTAEEKRLEGRTVVERFNSDLKDNHGGNFVRVRGWHKVHTHLMFGVLAIFAMAILRLRL